METLFPLQRSYPPGFTYVPDFLDAEQERELLEHTSKVALHTFNFRGYAAKRRVASFGYDYSFDKRSISCGQEIPATFHQLIEQVADRAGIKKEKFEELLVTEYPVGSVINWHRDAPPFDVIAGISLLSDCTFRLRPYDKTKRSRATIVSFPVKRRSLYVIQGPARTDWEHSIAPVTDVRYSLTLRTLRKRSS